MAKCIYSEKENIYSFNKLNKETVTLAYQKLFSSIIKEHLEIFRRNHLIREQDQSDKIVENSPHVIISRDRLISDKFLEEVRRSNTVKTTFHFLCVQFLNFVSVLKCPFSQMSVDAGWPCL